MRIVTRPDFDGVVCAALLLAAEPVTRPTLWVEPNDMQQGTVPVTTGDIVANLPHHPACSLWFDHHYTNQISVPFEGSFGITPSAARLIYDYYGDRLKRDYAELVRETDRIDSADLSHDEVMYPEKYPHVSLSMTISGHQRADVPYWERLTRLLRDHDIADVMADPEVDVRRREMILRNQRFLEILRKRSSIHDHVSVADFRGLHPLPEGNRFLVYSLFPDTMASVKVRFQHPDQRDRVIIGVGHSIFNRQCRVNVGLMLSDFNGGGHRGAGACTVMAHEADEALARIVGILNANRDNEKTA